MIMKHVLQEAKKTHLIKKSFLSISGGSPYPEFNNQELLKKLKSGYRMDKPDNCAQPM